MNYPAIKMLLNQWITEEQKGTADAIRKGKLRDVSFHSGRQTAFEKVLRAFKDEEASGKRYAMVGEKVKRVL